MNSNDQDVFYKDLTGDSRVDESARCYSNFFNPGAIAAAQQMPAQTVSSPTPASGKSNVGDVIIQGFKTVSDLFGKKDEYPLDAYGMPLGTYPGAYYDPYASQTSTGTWLLIGLGVVGLAVVGYFAFKK